MTNSLRISGFADIGYIPSGNWNDRTDLMLKEAKDGLGNF